MDDPHLRYDVGRPAQQGLDLPRGPRPRLARPPGRGRHAGPRHRPGAGRPLRARAALHRLRSRRHPEAPRGLDLRRRGQAGPPQPDLPHRPGHGAEVDRLPGGGQLLLHASPNSPPSNGATLVIPGTHLKAPPAWGQYPSDGAIPVEAPAGTAILVDGRTWHAAGINTNGELRASVTAYCAAPWIRQRWPMSMNMRDDVVEQLSRGQLLMLRLRHHVPERVRLVRRTGHHRADARAQQRHRPAAVGRRAPPLS